jgi:hypothetical protein
MPLELTSSKVFRKLFDATYLGVWAHCSLTNIFHHRPKGRCECEHVGIGLGAAGVFMSLDRFEGGRANGPFMGPK